MATQRNQGVYEFLNTLTGRRYIGSTSTLDSRGPSHLSTLKHGKHSSVDLQLDFDKYGHKHFVFGVLEYVDNVELLHPCEQKYIDKYGLENLYNKFNAVSKAKKSSSPLSASRKRWNADKDNNLRQFLEKHGPKDMWDGFIRVVQIDLYGKIVMVHDSAPKKVHIVCRQYGIDYKKRFRPRRVSKSFWAYERFVLMCNICKCKPEIDPGVFMCTSCGYTETHILNSLHNLEKYRLTYIDSEV